ncbi:unnamed protein product, partial [Gulo gulo]
RAAGRRSRKVPSERRRGCRPEFLSRCSLSPFSTQVSPSPSAVTGPKTEGNWDVQESCAGSADAAGPEGSAVSFCGDHGRGCDWKLLEMAATAAKRLNTGFPLWFKLTYLLYQHK